MPMKVTCGNDKGGNGRKRLRSEHVSENLLKGVDTKAATDAEVGKTKNDGNKSESNGAGNLGKIRRQLRAGI